MQFVATVFWVCGFPASLTHEVNAVDEKQRSSLFVFEMHEFREKTIAHRGRGDHEHDRRGHL